MINCDSLWNFVDQLLIQCHKIPKDNNVPKKLSTVKGHPLKIYQRHVAVIEVRNCFENILSGQYILLGIDIGDVDMILDWAWLNQVDPDIHCAKDSIFFHQ